MSPGGNVTKVRRVGKERYSVKRPRDMYASIFIGSFSQLKKTLRVTNKWILVMKTPSVGNFGRSPNKKRRSIKV